MKEVKEMEHLQDNCKIFLEYCRNNKRLTESTIRVYRFDLQHFNQFLGLAGQEKSQIKSYDEVTRLTLEQYLASLQSYSLKTIKRKFACVRSLFHYLEDAERISQNPFARFQINMREPYQLRTIMNLDEVKKVLSSAYGEKPASLPEPPGNAFARSLKITSKEFIWVRDIAVLETLFVAGLRVSELCELTFKDINLNYETLMIHGKGNKERLVYLENGEVILALSIYLHYRNAVGIDLPYLFITKFGQMLSTQAVRNLVTKYTRLAGINKNITPHVFRHTFASLLLEEGVDIKYIQDFLGHSSISTTQIYLHTTSRQKRRIIATQHPRQQLHFYENSTLDNVKLTSRRGEVV